MEPTKLEKLIIRYPQAFFLVALFLCFCVALVFVSGQEGVGVQPPPPFLFVMGGFFFWALFSFAVYLCNSLAKRFEKRLKASLRTALFCLQVTLLLFTITPFALLACAESNSLSRRVFD